MLPWVRERNILIYPSRIACGNSPGHAWDAPLFLSSPAQPRSQGLRRFGNSRSPPWPPAEHEGPEVIALGDKLGSQGLLWPWIAGKSWCRCCCRVTRVSARRNWSHVCKCLRLSDRHVCHRLFCLPATWLMGGCNHSWVNRLSHRPGDVIDVLYIYINKIFVVEFFLNFKLAELELELEPGDLGVDWTYFASFH